MQISPSVVLAGGGEGAEPLAGTPHSSPQAGGSLHGDTVSSRGRSRPDRARQSPGARFRFCMRSHFRGCRVIAPQRPGLHQAVYSRVRDRRGEAGRRGWGAWETAEPLGTEPGPTLGVEKASQRALPGRSEEGLTCQESRLQRPRLSLVRLFSTPGPLGTISANFHPLPKGLLLPREREAHPQGHPACQRHGQIWNSKPRAPCPGLLSLFFF